MKASSSIRLLSLALLLEVGCQNERSAGTSTETENAVTARPFRIDSLLPTPCVPFGEPVVATLRLDSSRFDFSSSRSDAADLDLVDEQGRNIPFAVVFWDTAESRGRLLVRIDPSARTAGAYLNLRSGLPPAGRSSLSAVWSGIPESSKVAWNSVLVDDFEGPSLLHSRLPDSSFWFLGGAIATSGSASSGAGRSGKSLHLSCNPGQCASDRGLLTATLLANSFRSLRSLDSIEIWARGSGRLWIGFEALDSIQMGRMSRGQIDSIEARRSWTSRTLDTAWKRLAIRPEDLDPPDGLQGNIGWTALRDSINYFSIHLEGGSEIWIDDIRLHGVLGQDLR